MALSSQCRSGPHRWRLHRHFSRARHQIELELDEFRRAVVVSLGAYAADATAQAPLQRAERLPFEPVKRIAGRVALRNRRTGKALVPVVVMAIRAGKIKLALALHEQ